jgi:hypothetical protein
MLSVAISSREDPILEHCKPSTLVAPPDFENHRSEIQDVSTTLRYIPEHGNICNYRCENLKSYIMLDSLATEMEPQHLNFDVRQHNSETKGYTFIAIVDLNPQSESSSHQKP